MLICRGVRVLCMYVSMIWYGDMCVRLQVYTWVVGMVGFGKLNQFLD